MSCRPAAAELACARADLEAFWPDTAAVYRPTLADNGQGGDSETLALQATTYACQLLPGNAREAPEGGRVQSAMTWRCLLPATADVRATDQLEINGRRYEVLDTDAGQSDRLVLTVALRRVS